MKSAITKAVLTVVAIMLIARFPAKAQAVSSETFVQEVVNPVVLKEGTEVQLKFAQAISSRTAVTGDSVSLTLGRDLLVGEVVVARTGAKALGTVSDAKKAGMRGKAGELDVRIVSLTAGDKTIRLTGTRNSTVKEIALERRLRWAP
jgi:hypothetical protein